MKLCVLGREPLNFLDKWAAECFSAMPNKNLPQSMWDSHASFFKIW